jgi:hypothetical protein
VSGRIVRGMDAAAYHAHPAESASKLKAMVKSASRYHAEHIAKTIERTETPAQRLGSGVHALVLEPEVFLRTYMTGPTKDRRAKGWGEAVAANPSKILLTADEMADVVGMANAIGKHPRVSYLLDHVADGDAEASYFWTDEDTGIECRCRMDATSVGVLELKTTNDLSRFERVAFDFAYHLSGAHYRAGDMAVSGRPAPLPVSYIVVETSAPYDVVVLDADERFLREGERLRRSCLRQLAFCRAEDRWPGPANGTLSLPSWMRTQGEDE